MPLYITNNSALQPNLISDFRDLGFIRFGIWDCGPPWRDDLDLMEPMQNAWKVLAFKDDLNNTGLGQGLGADNIGPEIKLSGRR